MKLNIQFAAISVMTVFFSPVFANQKMTVDDCHPEINISQNQYIVGYGSLIQSKSKNRTYSNSDENMPISVKGYERTWNMRSTKSKITFLGVKENQGSEFNGVMFQLFSADGIHQYDAREVDYCRKKINREQISLFNLKDVPEGEFWIYVPKPEIVNHPDRDYPITQSYVDIFISGCMDIEEKHHIQNYAFQCIETTKGWSYNWVNDREQRKYPESPEQNEIKKINFLLSTKLPAIFNEIMIR